MSAGREIRNNKVCIKQVSLGCYATRREALQALAEWQSKHLRLDMKDVTVSQVYNKIKGDWKESTQESLAPIYKRYEKLHDTPLREIRTYTIEDIQLPPMSKSSHDRIRLFWHRIMEFGVANDIIDKDYSQFIKFHNINIKPSRKKEIFTKEEIEICKGVELYRFLLYTGMRINELLSMKTEDVYEENGVLCFHVLKSKTEAGKRIIPVHSALNIDLTREYVIEPHLPYYKVKDQFNEFVVDNGFDYHTLHDFRRTFASYAMSCGCNEFYVKCLMGHVHHDVTKDVYTQAFVEDLKKEIEKIVL